nr:FG-GAP-like repeat-containing protein [Corallococcus carmarthensis]
MPLGRWPSSPEGRCCRRACNPRWARSTQRRETAVRQHSQRSLPLASNFRPTSRALLCLDLLGLAVPAWAATPVTFRPPVDSAAGAGPRAVAVADLNKDGTPDVVTANAVERTVSILTGTPTGPFTARQTAPLPGAITTPVATGDFDGDGRPDLVVAKEQANTVSLFRAVPPPPLKADAAVQLTARPILGVLVPFIAYDVRVTNNGPDPLTSTSVRAALPPGLSATSSECVPSPGAVTCGFGPLAPGASQTRSFRVPLNLLSLGLPYTVQASRAGGVPEDPNPLNDQASRSCTAVSILLVLCR